MKRFAPTCALAGALFAALCCAPSAHAAEIQQLKLEDYVLTGRYANGEVTFTLALKATTPGWGWNNAEAALLSGPVSLSGVPEKLARRLEWRDGSIVLKYGGWGSLDVSLPFRAQVKESGGWKTVEFTAAPANLRQLVLEGWPEAATLEAPGAAQLARAGGKATTWLPGAGPVRLRWKDAPPADEGKLFFSAEGAITVTVAPGLLQQTSQFTFRILQGKLEKIELDLDGAGDVTRVDGPGVLNWNVIPRPGADGAAPARRLVVQLNAPRTGEYPLTVQTQTTLPALPATVEPPRLAPAGALSFGGRLRVQNEGAVRLEVLQPRGLSQIAPEQFGPTATAASTTPRGGRGNAATAVPSALQTFAYRFADAGYAYTVRADNVLPELGVTAILAYNLGEADASVNASIELDIRDATLRELVLRIPPDWGVSQLEAPNLADYNTFSSAPAEPGAPAAPRDRLRLIFSSPLGGRQAVRLRLERNGALAGDMWALAPLVVEGAKNLRGFLGVTCDAGLRLAPVAASLANLTEAGPSTFPLKLDNLQGAWRFREEPWTATLRVERLATTIQVDALQLFSVGEGLLYGSTVLNLNIAGAPVSTIQLRNTGGYRNLEFAGRDLRASWKQLDDGVCELYFNRPVSGSYTLMATYERPFTATGETLPFTGLEPLGARSEQGHVVVASSLPFTAQAAGPVTGLLALETAEIPAEFRLLTDAPILAAYQYSARPFSANLALTPLPPGETVSQVVDIAELNTRVAGTGEVLTTARYLLKSKGADHLRLTLPSGARLWEVTVGGRTVVPVADGGANGALLVPLPRLGDPNTPQLLVVKFAQAPVENAGSRVTVAAPALGAPVLVTDWRLDADSGRRLRALDAAPVVAAAIVTPYQTIGALIFGGDEFAGGGTFWLALCAGLAGLLALRLARGRTLALKLAGAVAGAALCVWSVSLFAQLAHESAPLLLMEPAPEIARQPASGEGLHLSIPVVEPNRALTFALANEPAPEATPAPGAQPGAWLMVPGFLLLALGLWRRAGWLASLLTVAGALFLLSGALGMPSGVEYFFYMLAALMTGCALGALVGLRGPPTRPATPPGDGAAAMPAAAALALAFTALFAAPPDAAAADEPAKPEITNVVLSVSQRGEVRDGFARMTADIVWRAGDGARLALLGAPAVLTSFDKKSDHLKLTQENGDSGMNYILTAEDSDTYKFSITYEARTSPGSGANAATLALPTPGALVNDVVLDLDRPDIEASASSAVSLRTTPGPGGKPRVSASFPGGVPPSLSWVPRARDLSSEKPVFFVDWQQLYAPVAGLVDGRHEVRVRLAQGEIRELAFSVPPNLTIADVQSEGLAAWRFDPDKHKLLAYFEPTRKGAFTVVIRSQAAAAPLPYDISLAAIRLDGAATEVGLFAAATGSEVQLEQIAPEGLAPINLEDFPARLASAASTPGDPLVVRRAFSLSDPSGSLKLRAVAVEPDVRVRARQTLSLGEDRLVLAARLDVSIARAGIFQLSFMLPRELVLESVSGPQLSHFTETDAPDGRLVTMYLRGKTLGETTFNITVSGPGVSAQANWPAPRLQLRESAKLSGELILLPELGLRPQVVSQNGLTKLDPREAGVNAEGAFAFRLLQNDWSLGLEIQKLEPWVRVSGLQDFVVREGLVEVRANLEYQIDNAGVRDLRLVLPQGAVGVRIAGPLVSDFLPVEGSPGEWLVHLQRRSVGVVNLDINYQLVPPVGDTRLTLTGVRAAQANSQLGYLAIRTRGRLETRVPAVPPSLAAADWESLPAAMRRGAVGAAPSQTFRIVDPSFTLPVELTRHEAARVLPARVTGAELRSLASEDGQLLTTATVRLHPGSKRYLHLRLPEGAKFWFAFVNERGVTPSREGADFLIPLEPHPIEGQPAVVEFLYAQPLPAGARGWRGAAFAGPSFDLPLENISWQLFLPPAWDLTGWSGAWQKVDLDPNAGAAAWRSLDDYLALEQQRQQEQTREADQYLRAGNVLLRQGQQTQARSLFNNAYQISQHDAGFNEDARVQWQNLREQQALVALGNLRNFSRNGQAAPSAAAQGGAAAVNPVLSQSEVLNFTDQQARQILSVNAAEDNQTLARLAQRLVGQQALTLPLPAAIRATLPERGEIVAFTQSLQVNPWSDLTLNLTAAPRAPESWRGYMALFAVAVLAAAAVLLSRRPQYL